jgi:hypothetical protein
MTRQEAIINQLLAVKRNGVNIGNASQTLRVLIEAALYLVQNTPGQLPDAKGISFFREAGE